MKNKRVKLMAERLFLMDPNTLMTVVVTVEGDLGTEEIKKAVEKVYTRNQTTMSKMVLDEKGELYLEEMQQTGCKVFIENRPWEKLLYDNEGKTFHIDEGELVRTFIIPRGEKTDIYLMAHHLMCDGMGLFILVEDIMDTLQGKEVPYRETKVLTKKGTIKKGDLKFKQRLGLKLCNKKWKEEKQVYGWDDYYRIHEGFWKNVTTELVMTQMEGEKLEALKQEAKKLGITVNSYLVTKLLQEHPDCKNIGVPVSLRGQERSISNLIASVAVCYQYDQSKTFEENAKITDELVRKEVKKEGAIYHISQFLGIMDPTLVDAALMYHVLGEEKRMAKVMSNIIGYTGDTGTDLGVTNLKEIQIPWDYGRFKITSIIPVAPRILTSKHVITISTYQGRMLIAESKIVKKQEA